MERLDNYDGIRIDVINIDDDDNEKQNADSISNAETQRRRELDIPVSAPKRVRKENPSSDKSSSVKKKSASAAKASDAAAPKGLFKKKVSKTEDQQKKQNKKNIKEKKSKDKKKSENKKAENKKTKTKPQTTEYQERLRIHRLASMRRTLLTLGIILLVIVGILIFMEKRTYHNYKILKTSEQEDVISTSYTEMDGKILRYSPDGASLVTSGMETIWSELYEMSNPAADVCGSKAVIYDKEGTSMEIFSKDGVLGTVTTSYSIVKARVCKSGMVAAILDAGDDTWIDFYASDGSLIAENQTKVDDPGYPMDLSISESGLIMMVAYQFVDGGETTSYVAFYNFGDVGQSRDDRIVSGYTYEGTVVPEVHYLDNNRYIAIRDNGITIYKGKQIPKEDVSIDVDAEIVSTFYDEDIVGLVFKNTDADSDKLYKMQVYTISGSLKFEKEFNIPYTVIKTSRGQIIMYNDSQICIYNSRGTEKYNGTVDGTIKNFFKIGWNKYLLVLDTGISTIKLT